MRVVFSAERNGAPLDTILLVPMLFLGLAPIAVLFLFPETNFLALLLRVLLPFVAFPSTTSSSNIEALFLERTVFPLFAVPIALVLLLTTAVLLLAVLAMPTTAVLLLAVPISRGLLVAAPS